MAPQDQDSATDPASYDPFDGWRDAGVDPAKPDIARVHDYWLGGHHNLVADRELAEAMATLDPWIPAACKANRAFLGRAVRFLAAQGIRQFLDIGSGIPTAGNVHEIAQSAAADARVVYVDRNPVAVAVAANCSREMTVPLSSRLIFVTWARSGRPSWADSTSIRAAPPLREEAARPQRTIKGKETTRTSPFSIYSAPGDLPQDPGHAA